MHASISFLFGFINIWSYYFKAEYYSLSYSKFNVIFVLSISMICIVQLYNNGYIKLSHNYIHRSSCGQGPLKFKENQSTKIMPLFVLSYALMQCCGSGSYRIRIFLVGSGSGPLGPDPYPDPGLNK
jgi:hypothetical protein